MGKDNLIGQNLIRPFYTLFATFKHNCKFNKIDQTTIAGLSSGSIIGAVRPTTGINFVANEIVQGITIY